MSARTHYAGKLLAFGVMTFGFGIWLAAKSWVFKSELIPVNGPLSLAEVYVTPVESSKGARSNKSELIFHLEGCNQRFILMENIGNDYTNTEYERIKRKLKNSRNISVYIEEDDVNEIEPKVYQIEGDNEVILAFEKVRTEHSTMAAFMLLLGFSSIVTILYFRKKPRSELSLASR